MSEQRLARIGRPASKVLDEEIVRLRRERPPGPLKLSGYPTDPLPPHILDAVAQAARANAIAPSAGMPQLRRAIASKLHEENSVPVDPDGEILITHGAMHAVHLVLQTVLEPGDEVLMFSPTYFFGGLVELTRGKSVYAPLSSRDGFRVCADALEAKVSSRTRVLLLNSPCNPTGCVPTESELRAIAEFAERHDLLIVSDESYEKFVYDGRRHVSIASFDEAHERTVTIQSFTKSFGMAGWRIGYLAGPRRYVSAAQTVLEWTGLMCNCPAQIAATAALLGPREWFTQIVERFEANRNVLYDVVAAIPTVHAVKPASTPFLLLNVLPLGVGTTELCRQLLLQDGIPCVAGEAFEAPGHVRIPFGGATETVTAAAARLASRLRGDAAPVERQVQQ